MSLNRKLSRCASRLFRYFIRPKKPLSTIKKLKPAIKWEIFLNSSSSLTCIDFKLLRYATTATVSKARLDQKYDTIGFTILCYHELPVYFTARPDSAVKPRHFTASLTYSLVMKGGEKFSQKLQTKNKTVDARRRKQSLVFSRKGNLQISFIEVFFELLHSRIHFPMYRLAPAPLQVVLCLNARGGLQLDFPKEYS